MRVRLILLVVATTSLVLVAFLVPLALLVRAAAADRAVSAAVVEAQALAPTVATVDDRALNLAVAEANNGTRHPVTVFLPDGRVLGADAPRSPDVELATGGRSMTVAVPGGRVVLVAVSGLPGGTAVIRTFVPERDLTRGVGRAWLVLALLGLGLLAVSVLVADRLAGTVIRPLAGVAAAAHRLASGDLGVRATPGGPPEVRQVGTGLNLLAARIGQLLAREREATADLSHRLRTPLTALRIDAETLSSTTERTRITAHLDALERTVDEIIRTARRGAQAGVATRCDATVVVAERVAFWTALADEERRTVTLAVHAGPIPVRVSADDLAACLDALLDNVFAHTPDGSGFAVRLAHRAGGGARLTVTDEGPGLSGARPDRGASGAGSTGLGLDIVRRIAAESGGQVILNVERPAGAEITVELGPPAY